MRTSGWPVRRVAFVLAFVLLFGVALSPAPGLASDTHTVLQLVASDEGYTGPVTVRTRVALGSQIARSNQGVWLAGFAGEPGGTPSVLAVSLSQVRSGWLGPMWGCTCIRTADFSPDGSQGSLAPGLRQVPSLFPCTPLRCAGITTMRWR